MEAQAERFTVHRRGALACREREWVGSWYSRRQCNITRGEGRKGRFEGVEERYLYDENGVRIKKTRGGTDTFYINRYFEVDVPPAEGLGETGSGVKTKYYYFGDWRVAMRSLSVLTMLHSDHLGSTVAATQSGATNVQKYKAFGANRSAGDVHTDHLFTGQKQDGTGLLYYRARYYDKLLGTFISPDPLIPDATNVFAYNRYIYTLGNPLKYTDPTGHQASCMLVDNSIACSDGVPGISTVNIDPDAAVSASGGDPKSFYTLMGGLFVGSIAAPFAAMAAPAILPSTTTATTAACGDGDCTNEIDVSSRIGQNVWQMDKFARGRIIEDHLGRSVTLSRNFPVVDRWKDGVATSIKSINLNATTYQNAARLRYQVTQYVVDMAKYSGQRTDRAGVSIRQRDVVSRAIELAIPPGASVLSLMCCGRYNSSPQLTVLI